MKNFVGSCLGLLLVLVGFLVLVGGVAALASLSQVQL